MQEVNQFYQSLRKSPSSIINLVFAFRFISLTLTSIFYLLGPQSPLYFKVGVIVSLCFAAWIITDIQRKHFQNITIMKSTVLAEILGLTLLLFPTGGISSPFIWYALNPVLVASFLTTLFCFGALIFYLGSATFITYQLFHIDNLFLIIEEKSYFYLVCLLITMLVRLFSGLTKELYAKTAQLKEQQAELVNVNSILTDTNQKYQQTLDHVMSLYHLMENFNSNTSMKKLVKEITSALKTCTQCNEVFFWMTELNNQQSYMENSTKDERLEMELLKNWPHIRMKRRSFTCKMNHGSYLMKIIRNANNVGVIGVKVSNGNENTILLHRPFEYLAELSEIMLEKLYMDQMMDQMLIIEEQNRIANEIHDSVSQRLFGLVCALHSLQVKGPGMTQEELNQEYRFLSQSANTTIKELRTAIYRLSSVKKGEKPFLVRLKKYLDEYARLNNIRINYQIVGDEAIVSDKLKQALYRIICEACGNAVRHGECHVIDLRLSFLDENTVLMIQDDGNGFDQTLVGDKTEKGVGLMNMRNIVRSFTGTISINGSNGSGTAIQIEIPNEVRVEQEAYGY